jgi:hypothetical protein
MTKLLFLLWTQGFVKPYHYIRTQPDKIISSERFHTEFKKIQYIELLLALVNICNETKAIAS